jgi:predicted O-methyltransferase YrrM
MKISAVLAALAATCLPLGEAAARDPDAAKLAGFAGPSACKYRGAAKAAGAEVKYEFSADWFSDHIPVWTRLLAPLKGQRLRYLEVGVYEGRSLLFVLDNILQHPASQAIAVDIAIREEYLRNVARSGACKKVRNYQGPSQTVLRYLPAQSFDVIYIDGSHTASDVLVDAVLAFDLLRIDGLLIFDDYLWRRELPDDLRPHVAVSAFMTAYRHRLTLERRDLQVVLRKRAHPCGNNLQAVSPVGEYCYDWDNGTLSRRADGQPVRISGEEKRIVEAIARLPRFGEITASPDAKLRDDPAFRSLNARLRLVP